MWNVEWQLQNLGLGLLGQVASIVFLVVIGLLVLNMFFKLRRARRITPALSRAILWRVVAIVALTLGSLTLASNSPKIALDSGETQAERRALERATHQAPAIVEPEYKPRDRDALSKRLRALDAETDERTLNK